MLKAYDYGIPQNRERVFVVSIRKDVKNVFEFPKPFPLRYTLKDFLDKNVEDKYYIYDGTLNPIVSKNQAGFLSNGKWDKVLESCKRYYKEDGIAPTLHTCQGGNSQPKVYLKDENKVRKLTPKEFFLLMGFDKELYYKAETVNSMSQLYKQAGNSIVVNILYYLFKNLYHLN